MNINSDYLKNLDRKTIARYNKRIEKYGVHPKSLGWGSKEDQLVRFSAAARIVDFSNKTILDIGCGFSDLYKFLKDKDIPIKEYRGIDINPKLIELSRKKYPHNNYEIRDFSIDKYKKKQADIVIMFGLLNFRLESGLNLKYSEKMIREAFKITKEVLIVDFLSSNRTPFYPKEDFVYYHKLTDAIKTCLKQTNNFVIAHDYKPIPQKEFIAVLRKKTVNEGR